MSTGKMHSVTKKQKKLMRVVAEEWIANGLSTERVDIEEATKYVNMAYDLAGLEPPSKVVFTASPHAGMIAANLISDGTVGVDEIDRYDDFTIDMVDGVARYIQPFHGGHEGGWLAFYDFFRRIGLKEETAKIEGVSGLAKSSGWCWFFTDIAVVADRPTKISLDDRGRLHCEDGHALEYPDGHGVLSWHGVRFPEEYASAFNDRSNLTLDVIDACDNAEIRRSLCEMYGWIKYFKDSGAVIVDETIDQLGSPMRLWSKDIGGREPVVMLEVINATMEPDGSHKSYTLRVPPDIKTADDAKMWTFGVEDVEWGEET